MYFIKNDIRKQVISLHVVLPPGISVQSFICIGVYTQWVVWFTFDRIYTRGRWLYSERNSDFIQAIVEDLLHRRLHIFIHDTVIPLLMPFKIRTILNSMLSCRLFKCLVWQSSKFQRYVLEIAPVLKEHILQCLKPILYYFIPQDYRVFFLVLRNDTCLDRTHSHWQYLRSLSLASIPTHLPLNFIFSGVVDWRPCLRVRAMRCYFIAKYVGFQVSGLRKPENFTFLVSQSLTYFIRKDRHCTPYPRPPTGLR